MFVNWDEIQKALSPIKDYDDLCKRMHKSFSYPFVQTAFNFTLPRLVTYTMDLLGGDARQRYTAYSIQLTNIMHILAQAGIQDIQAFIECVTSPEQLESFTQLNETQAIDLIHLAKFLVYWFIPGEKSLSGIVPTELELRQAVRVLVAAGIPTNLDLLQAGLTPSQRESLAATTGLSLTRITDLVNRADFSRLPWASKATIANIIGAGYPSMAALASAEPGKLLADFFSYGKSIGKNLKLGNEIENSYRIARLVPKLVT